MQFLHSYAVYRLLICPQLFWNIQVFHVFHIINRFWISTCMRVSLWFHYTLCSACDYAYLHRAYIAGLCILKCACAGLRLYVGRVWATGGYGASCIQLSPQKGILSLVTTMQLRGYQNYNVYKALPRATLHRLPWTSTFAYSVIVLLQSLQHVIDVTVVTKCNSWWNRCWLLNGLV